VKLSGFLFGRRAGALKIARRAAANNSNTGQKFDRVLCAGWL
jgi:hypothetical protein